MSLILTTISRRGIIQAADSNLTGNAGAAGVGQKVFAVPDLGAALSLAGSYSVAGVPMDAWIQQAIAPYSTNGARTLAGLAESLRGRLELEMTQAEKSGGSLIHLCGYVRGDNSAHPEFHFVRNITGIDAHTGAYSGVSPSFEVSEDFWTRDYATPETRNALAAGGQQVYINGYPAGRIGYLALMKHFGEFLKAVWSVPQWKFRPPTTLHEESLLVELQLRAIGACFHLSDYPAPYIGGEPQIERLAAPQDCVPFL